MTKNSLSETAALRALLSETSDIQRKRCAGHTVLA